MFLSGKDLICTDSILSLFTASAVSLKDVANYGTANAPINRRSVSTTNQFSVAILFSSTVCCSVSCLSHGHACMSSIECLIYMYIMGACADVRITVIHCRLTVGVYNDKLIFCRTR